MTLVYGDFPVTATAVDKEELNQPRYWSLPSKYTSAGRLWSSRCIKTASCEEPESNQTSIISVSFVNFPFGLCSDVNPSGNKSFASHSNQIFDPCSRKRFDTWLIVSSVMIGSLFSA